MKLANRNMQVKLEKGHSLILISLVLLTILNSGSLVVKTMGDNAFTILQFLLVAYIGLRYKIIPSKNFAIVAIICFSIVLHYLMHFNSLVSYIGLLVRIISMYYLSLIITNQTFWKKYISIIYIISLFSIVGYIAILIVPDHILHRFSTLFPLHDISYSGDINYHNLGIITWPVRSYGNMLRNQSIFWEPGAFQLFVNLGLLANLKLQNKIYDRKNIVFIVTVITTFSTTGYIVLAIILFDRIQFKHLYKNGVMILSTIVLLLLILTSPAVKDKFDPNSQGYGSYLARVTHATYGYSMLMENLVIGFGYGENSIKEIDSFAYNNYGYGSGGGSNHLLRFYGQFGIIIATIFLYQLYRYKSRIVDHYYLHITIVTFWVTTEHFITTPIILALMFINISRGMFSPETRNLV
jgi:hypothetical protein